MNDVATYFCSLQGTAPATVGVSSSSNEVNPPSHSARDATHTPECITENNETEESHERVKYCVIEDGHHANSEEEGVVPLLSREHNDQS